VPPSPGPPGSPDLPVRVDETSALPVFEQIQTQVVDLVGAGALAPGARLPSVRSLADQLGVAPGTVAKAYRGLEQEGFVVTAGRNGTRVADQQGSGSEPGRAAVRAALQPLLDAGRTPAEVLALVRSVLAE